MSSLNKERSFIEYLLLLIILIVIICHITLGILLLFEGNPSLLITGIIGYPVGFSIGWYFFVYKKKQNEN